MVADEHQQRGTPLGEPPVGEGADPAPSTSSRPSPSGEATDRLRRELREEVERYRAAVADDLHRVRSAQGRGESAEALELLHTHIEALERLHGEVNRIVAGAVVEREAEAVLDEVAPGHDPGR